MKLTVDQMFLLQEACTLRAEQLLERSHLAATAKDGTSADYWKQEAAAAHQLSLLFKDAIKVEITTAALEPATPASQEVARAALQRSQARLEAQLQPLRQRAAAKHPLAASQEPATPAKEAHPQIGQAQAACPPSAAAAHPAPLAESPEAQEGDAARHSLHKQVQHALAEGDPNGSLEGWSAEDQAQASSESTDQSAPLSQPSLAPQRGPASLPQSGSSIVSASAKSQQSQPRSSSHSSVHPAEPCGDINCDGCCRAAA
ncbi:hypothetical protein [Prosthecobacter vanneervenii]|uniref:Uncharacterized protein n=1 Tax=Prosthecobacter vanneervenii TaxID=48466 RepID=A0A7W7YBJ6_9BACT|nr:hypothetical protein [Prosthecobacter vanneervenii]MBB5033149.1 hypothetical protein [Prosthecobacter vanneervenii]